MDQEYIKKIILTYPEANGLPENIIQNIAKIAVLQNKVDKPAWILKMVYDAKKKFEQSLAAKKLKIESKVQENKNSIKNIILDFSDYYGFSEVQVTELNKIIKEYNNCEDVSMTVESINKNIKPIEQVS